jgi:hypothetical protein
MEFAVFHVRHSFLVFHQARSLLLLDIVPAFTNPAPCPHTCAQTLVLVVDKADKSRRYWVTKPGIQKRKESETNSFYFIYFWSLSFLFG